MHKITTWVGKMVYTLFSMIRRLWLVMPNYNISIEDTLTELHVVVRKA